MERIYTIPLRNAKKDARTVRTPRAVKEVQKFLKKHMKTETVKIDSAVNEKLWERGIQKIPSKIKIKAVKDSDGIVEATLAE